MKAEFKLDGLHEPVLVIEPDWGVEAILAAVFIHYDANVFVVSVDRREDGQIKSLTFRASNS